MNSWEQSNQNLATLPSSSAGALVLGQVTLVLECRSLSVCPSGPFNPSSEMKAHIFGPKPEVTLDS